MSCDDCAGMRELVDVRISFIVQNATDDDSKCHVDDGWQGPYGTADCLLDRYNLCALNLGTAGSKQDYAWFDFMVCTYRNQAATTPKVPDDGKNAQRFSATVDYCAAVAGVPAGPLRSCAQDKALSTQLLQASHATDLASNTNVDADGHHHPTWVQIAGATNANASDWLRAICAEVPVASQPVICATA